MNCVVLRENLSICSVLAGDDRAAKVREPRITVQVGTGTTGTKHATLSDLKNVDGFEATFLIIQDPEILSKTCLFAAQSGQSLRHADGTN